MLAGRKRKGPAGVVGLVPAERKGTEQGPALAERRGKELGPVGAVGPVLVERRRKGQGPAVDQGRGRGLGPQGQQNRLPASLK